MFFLSLIGWVKLQPPPQIWHSTLQEIPLYIPHQTWNLIVQSPSALLPPSGADIWIWWLRLEVGDTVRSGKYVVFSWCLLQLWPYSKTVVFKLIVRAIQAPFSMHMRISEGGVTLVRNCPYPAIRIPQEYFLFVHLSFHKLRSTWRLGPVDGITPNDWFPQNLKSYKKINIGRRLLN